MPSNGTPADPSSAGPEYADVAPEALVQVGFVFRAHGMKGELKVNPEHTDDPSRFEELGRVYLGRDVHEVTEHEISSVRYQETKRGTTVILGLADVTTRSDAEAVMKLDVYANDEDLELGEGEIFIHELVGLAVVTEAGERLGTVANYMEMPAQDVFVITRPDKGEAMIPAVEGFIIDVNLEGGKLVVRPIDGLLE